MSGLPGLRKHPRLRGEDSTPMTSSLSVMETPPLTRGRRREARGLGRRLGNTPAYAGKTGGEPPAAPRRRKHPRLRGEDTGPTKFASVA